MNGPTLLSPWYVVQRLEHTTIGLDRDLYPEIVKNMTYYTSMEDGGTEFTREPKRAMLSIIRG